MAEDVHKISVKIGGMQYQLLAAENEAYIRQVAAHADEMIRRVLQNNPQLNLSMSTVLALVNAVDELHHAFQDQQNSRKIKDEAERNSAEIKAELSRLREQMWELKKELLHSQSLCKEYEERLSKFDSEKAADHETLVPPESDAAKFMEPEPVQEIQGSGIKHPFEQTRLDDFLPDQ